MMRQKSHQLVEASATGRGCDRIRPVLRRRESALAIEPERTDRDSDVALPSGKADRPTELGHVLDGAAASMDNVDRETFAGLLRRLADLRRRLDDQHLHVAIVGQFKRGKSTVLNALLG